MRQKNVLGQTLDIYNPISLCTSIPEILLHVTLKRQAEILADMFARLLRYFCLSCKNMTISRRDDIPWFQVLEDTRNRGGGSRFYRLLKRLKKIFTYFQH